MRALTGRGPPGHAAFVTAPPARAQVQEALRRAGLESSNLILAVDYTKVGLGGRRLQIAKPLRSTQPLSLEPAACAPTSPASLLRCFGTSLCKCDPFLAASSQPAGSRLSGAVPHSLAKTRPRRCAPAQTVRPSLPRSQTNGPAKILSAASTSITSAPTSTPTSECPVLSVPCLETYWPPRPPTLTPPTPPSRSQGRHLHYRPDTLSI